MPTYVQLPPDDVIPGEENMCGRLHFSIYWTLDAAAIWSEECTDRLVPMGFTVGKASPCAFVHSSRGLGAYVHGDNFVVIGMPNAFACMQSKIEEKYALDIEIFGPDSGQCKEVRVLNRSQRSNN